MSGGNRRRTSNRSSQGPPPQFEQFQNCEDGIPTVPPLPKHINFPDVPHNEFFNELFIFAFTIVSVLTQFMHLYRTVWWLPDSYTHQTINFYLVDPYLAIFILTMLGRRFFYSLSCKLIELVCSEKIAAYVSNINKYIFFDSIILILSYCTVNLFHKHSNMYIFFLSYPLIVYCIIFGFKIEPFLRTVTETESTYLSGIPLHSCSSNPSDVRDEVEALKTDFNARFKQVVYTSLVNAYYAGFIPCCFAHNFIFYDIYWATQHLAFIWIGGFMMCMVYSFPAKYSDVLHRSSLHLGQWVRIERPHLPPALVWSKTISCPQGTLVRHAGEFYKSVGPITAAIPANSTHNKFYFIFHNPSEFYLILSAIQFVIVTAQLLVLVFTNEWHNVLSLSFLILDNLYTLFKLARDYIVTQKIYAAEYSNYKVVEPWRLLSLRQKVEKD